MKTVPRITAASVLTFSHSLMSVNFLVAGLCLLLSNFLSGKRISVAGASATSSSLSKISRLLVIAAAFCVATSA